MLKRKNFKFKVDGNYLYCGDDTISLNSVKCFSNQDSFMNPETNSIVVYTTRMVLELYFKGTPREVEKQLTKLCEKLQDENPQFYLIGEYIVNFDNIKEIIYLTKYIKPYINIVFKDSGCITFPTSKENFEEIKQEFEDYIEIKDGMIKYGYSI